MTELVGEDWTLDPRKRMMDLIGIGALTPIFAPVGLVIAEKIIDTDGWDPIFVQQRIGQGFEPFDIYKFRTMHPETPDTPSSKGSADVRRSNLGSKLSAYHLDEMPNSINIYNGTMSAVGPRALLIRDIVHTYDILDTPKEQRAFTRSIQTTKPGEFGPFQLQQHHSNYNSTVYDRALAAIDYAQTASFSGDMKIIADTGLMAFKTFLYGLPAEVGAEHVRGKSGAKMFSAVAKGFGVQVTTSEFDAWQANLLAARLFDDLVDDAKITDATPYIQELLAGHPIPGMTQHEATFFAASYWAQSIEHRQRVLTSLLALPAFAAAKTHAGTSQELLHINEQEALLFATPLQLESRGEGREKFNRWMIQFSRSGYAADLAVDAIKDHENGLLGLRLSAIQRAYLGAKAIKSSANLVTKTSVSSYLPLLRGSLRTLQGTAI